MPDKVKKTENMKAYQEEYRKTHKKDPVKNLTYMKKYIADAETVDCPVCGGHFKTYSKYKHDRTTKHIKALVAIKDKEEKAELKKKEEEAQEKALAEQKKNEEKGHPSKPESAKPKKKKKFIIVESPKQKEKPEEKEKEKEKEKPKKKKRLIVQGEVKVHKKSEALSALSKYGSDAESSSSESESEEEKEKPESAKGFKLPNKEIKAAEVEKFLVEHFEGSANPNRSTASKTPRVNKNLTVWKKILKTIGDKNLNWKYVGEHFHEIVEKAYNKSSSQADAVQMLKLLFIHFGDLDVENQKRISGIVRKLKESHVEKQTELPENGVTYEDMKKEENNENQVVALLMRLYSKDIPALRIYDWINAYVGKNKEMNEIDLKAGKMIRHIKKNQEEHTADDIPLPKSLIEYIKKKGIKGALLGDVTAKDIDVLLKKTFPNKTANPRYFRDLYSVKVAPTLSKERLIEVLKIMDHSAETHAKYYHKSDTNPLLDLVIKK